METHQIISTNYDHATGRHHIESVVEGDTEHSMRRDGVPQPVFDRARGSLACIVRRARIRGVDVTRAGTVLKDDQRAATVLVCWERNQYLDPSSRDVAPLGLG